MGTESLVFDTVVKDYYRLQQEYNNAKNKAMVLMIFTACNIAWVAWMIQAMKGALNTYGMYVFFVGGAVLVSTCIRLCLTLRSNEVSVLQSEYFADCLKSHDLEIALQLLNAYQITIKKMRETNSKINCKLDMDLLAIMVGIALCWVGICAQLVL